LGCLSAILRHLQVLKGGRERLGRKALKVGFLRQQGGGQRRVREFLARHHPSVRNAG